jgi:hypothetical protein
MCGRRISCRRCSGLCTQRRNLLGQIRSCVKPIRLTSTFAQGIRLGRNVACRERVRTRPSRMEPWGFEPQIQPCHGRVIPFHYGPDWVLSIYRAFLVSQAGGAAETPARRDRLLRRRDRRREIKLNYWLRAYRPSIVPWNPPALSVLRMLPSTFSLRGLNSLPVR